MQELIDTNSQYPDKKIADGKHTFTVEKVVGKKLGNAYGYIWTLEENGILFEQVMFGNEMKDLLRILGCKEESPGKFQLDTDQVPGKSFTATVEHLVDKKGTIRQKFTKVEDEVPF
jgi:hypothetical protein